MSDPAAANSAHPPVFASDAWMHEQQMRAEWEAAEWRRLRAELNKPQPIQLPPPQAQPQGKPLHEGGSIILKGLVRFAIGAFGGWMGWISAASSGGGDIDIWFSVLFGFFLALGLSMLSPARQFVALLAEITRWTLILAVAIGAMWFAMQMHNT